MYLDKSRNYVFGFVSPLKREVKNSYRRLHSNMGENGILYQVFV